MTKTLRIISLFLLSLFAITLTACNNDKAQEAVDSAKAELAITYATGDTATAVTGNLTLVSAVGDVIITWSSNNTAVIANDGSVTRPAEDTQVTLTATLTYEEITASKDFILTVLAAPDEMADLRTALEALYADTIGDIEYVVPAGTESIDLVSTINGATVTWASSDVDYVAIDGSLTFPSFTEGDQNVTLTATITKDSQTIDVTFFVFLTKLAKTDAERAAEALLRACAFSAAQMSALAEDLELPATAADNDAVSYPVTWTTNNAEVIAADGTVVMPLDADVSVTLTAHIVINTVEFTKTVTFNVLKVPDAPAYTTIAEMIAAGADKYIKLVAVTVIGKINSGFFLTDGTDIIYVYGSATVTLGATYDITAFFKWYYNSPELDKGSEAWQVIKVEVSEASAKTLAPTPVTDIGAFIDGLSTPSAETPFAYEYIQITGKVFIQGTGNYNTYLVPTSFSGAAVYTDTPGYSYYTDAIMVYYQSNMAAFSSLNGKTVTVNLITHGWRSDRLVWYADYCGTTEAVEVLIEDDTEAVDAALAAITFPATIVEDVTLTMPSTLFGVGLTYASSNTSVITNAGVVDANQVTQMTVTVTVTATRGAVTKTKDIVVKVGVVPLRSIADSIAQGAGATIRTKGVITAIDGNAVFIQDATAGLYLYNVGSVNAFKSMLVIGNEIEITALLSPYNGWMETAVPTACTVISTGNPAPAPFVLPSIEQANFTDRINALASINGLILKAKPTTVPDSSNSGSYTLTDGVNDIILRLNKYNADITALSAYLQGLAIGAPVNIVAMPVTYSGGKAQFYITSLSQITAGTVTDVLNADKNAIVLAADALSAGTLTLPSAGAYGSAVISWAIKTGTGASITGSVITFPAVTENTLFTLTATVTIGSDSVTKDFDVTVRLLTDAEKVAEAKAAITLANPTQFDIITLAATGLNGTTLTWEIVSGAPDVTLAAGKLTFGYTGTNYSATIRVTIAINTVSDTKEFALTVTAPMVLTVSQAYDRAIGFGTASGTVVDTAPSYVIGTIIGFRFNSSATYNEGIFLSDGTKYLYCHVSSTGLGDGMVVGDVVILKGTIQTYSYLPQLSTLTFSAKVAGTPAVVTPLNLSIADIYGYTNLNTPYYGAPVKVVGTLVVGTSDTSTYIQNQAGQKLYFYRSSSFLAGLATLNGKEVTYTGFLLDYSTSLSAWRITGTASTFVITEAQIAKDEIAALSLNTSVSSGDVVTLPVVAGTSSITWAMTANDYASLSGNTLTINNVAVTQTVILTATVSHPVTGGDPIVTVKDYTFTISTPEAKLLADKTALTVAAQVEMSTLTLPTTGSNGSAIVWTMDASTDASLAVNVVTLNYKGSAYQIVLHATLTLGTFSDTKDFTVDVSAVSVITDLATVNAKTDSAWTVIDGNYYLRGVVTYINGTNGVYIQDADGDGMYCYNLNATTAGVLVGDDVILKGNLTTYNSVREMTGTSLKAKLASEIALVYTTMTPAEVAAILPAFWEYQGQLTKVTGLVVSSYNGNYLNLVWTSADSTNYYLSFYYKGSTAWFADVYQVGDALPELTFLFQNIFYKDGNPTTTYNITGVVAPAMTDAQKVAYDLSQLPDSQELTAAYSLPTLKYSASYGTPVISAELTSNLTYATGIFTPTLGSSDIIGTVTVSVTSGAVTDSKVINVTVKAMSEAEKMAIELAALPSTLTLEANYSLPVLTYGTYSADASIEALFGTNLILSADKLSLEVTRPAFDSSDLVGTVTLTITIGSTTQTKNITVTVKRATAGLFTFEVGKTNLTTSYTDNAAVTFVNDGGSYVMTGASHRIADNKASVTGATNALVISPRLGDDIAATEDGKAWIELNFGTDVVSEMEFDIYYWNATAIPLFTKIELQVKTAGEWVTVTNLQNTLNGVTSIVHVSLSGLSGSQFRIYAEGGQSESNNARVCVDNLKIYK